jgi:hypothetical protein
MEGLNHGAAGAAVSWPMHARWAIDRLLRLDASNVGFLGAYLLVGTTRQRVIEAVLAVVSLDQPESFLETLSVSPENPACRVAAVARALRKVRSKPLLAAAYGEAPDGFLPAIARSTFRRPHSYRRLHRMLSQRHERPKARALAYCDLKDELLDFADALPAPLIRPSFLNSVQNMHEARLIEASYNGLQQLNPTATESDFRGIENAHAFRKAVMRALTGIEFAAPPAPGEPGVMEPVSNGADLKRLSHKFRNCLENTAFALEILSRRLFIYEFIGEPGAIVSVRRLNGLPHAWLVSSIDGLENQHVHEDTREIIRQWFERNGVATLRRPERPEPFDAVAQLLRGSLIGLEDYIFG